ncbi:acetyltransferase [Marinomonas sp. S3726]|uniref:acetyltransferase n=1 Tax=Marinomonas sp. S3726 TaxID=579484 RepID=UPI0005FA60BD|nr:acetyltransferase [Marinomonas sp. S3726]
MLKALMQVIAPFRPLLGVLSFLHICLVTLGLASLLHLAALYYFLWRPQDEQRSQSIYHQLYETWFAAINFWLRKVLGVNWALDKEQKKQADTWQFVIANHQSWVDIFVVFAQIQGRMPLPKVFMKHNLIWIPLVGTATYLMGFPFMRRYSKAFLAKHPHLKGKDIETTRRSCRRFMQAPNTVLSFVEGTRWSQMKHDQQDSPYQYLLKPKTGGVAFVLQAMPDKFQAIVDMSVIYPQENISFWDLLCGRLKSAKVVVRNIPFPDKVLSSTDFQPAGIHRLEFNDCFNQFWAEKDKRIGHYKAALEQEANMPKQGAIKSS